MWALFSSKISLSKRQTAGEFSLLCTSVCSILSIMLILLREQNGYTKLQLIISAQLNKMLNPTSLYLWICLWYCFGNRQRTFGIRQKHFGRHIDKIAILFFNVSSDLDATPFTRSWNCINPHDLHMKWRRSIALYVGSLGCVCVFYAMLHLFYHALFPLFFIIQFYFGLISILFLTLNIFYIPKLQRLCIGNGGAFVTPFTASE